MSKIILAVLTAAAFAYALWLVVTGGTLPHPGHATGLRRRFCLATLLFVGLLTTAGSRAGQPVPTCYTPPPLPPPQTTQPTGQQALVATLKAVWRTLDAKQNDEFRQRLEAAVGQGAIQQKTADMLAIAHAELAYHKYRTRGEGARMTCYRPTIMGETLMKTCENALKQIQLLAEAEKAGKIDAPTASRAQAALAGELEMLYQARRIGQPERQTAERQLTKLYQEGKVVPGDSAEVAAAMIVEMESGQAVSLTPGRRLMNMKQRVRDVFKTRLKANDWQDPAIQPNLAEILARADLLSARDVVPDHTCYSRALSPVEERSEELAELQKRLLDKHLLLGTLDGSRYTRLVEAQRREDAELQARLASVTEKDLQTFQEKAREAVRALYQKGELPPSLVEEVEHALDVDVLDLKPGDALRAELGFCLRGRVHDARHRQVLTWLEEQKLIPPADNRRGEMTGAIDPDSYKLEQQAMMKALKEALNRDEEASLAGDEAVRIARSTLPEQELDYRLRMRRVVRLLLKNSLLDQRHDLRAIEECLGVPLIGTLETGQTGRP